MLVTLTEVYKDSRGQTLKNYKPKYTLRSVVVNPEHVMYIREETSTLDLLHEGLLPDGIDSRARFSRVTVDRPSSADLIIVGSPEQIQEKLILSRKKMLKG